MKKVLARVVLATTIITGIGVAGAQAVQSQPGCSLDQVCLYDYISFEGELWGFFTGTPYVGNNVNDRASSVFNNTASVVRLYSDANYFGFYVCLSPNSGIDDLSFVGLNNAISSIEIGGVCS